VSLAHIWETDSEDCESYNSIIKASARIAPGIGPELLTARCNLKSDIGFATNADHKRPIRQLMKIGSEFYKQLLPFASSRVGRRALKSVIYSEGRFADAKRLDGIPTEEQIELHARESDPQAFPDLKGDRAMNWAAAHSKLLHQHLKTKKLYSQFICIGPVSDDGDTTVFLPADSCRSVHFCVAWKISRSRNAIEVELPFRSMNSVDIFKVMFDAVHADTYELTNVSFIPADWSSLKERAGSPLSVTMPPADKIEAIMDVVPGLKYSTSERTKKMCKPTIDEMIEAGNEEVFSDLTAAYSSPASIEADLAKVIEAELAENGEEDMDRRED
jgi:hypothetical protein